MTIEQQTKYKELEIKTIPEKWDGLELCKFAELVKDTCLPSADEEFSYIGLEHINQQTLSLNSVGKSSDVISNKFRFKEGDILFGKLRPYFRKVYKPKFSGICSTDIWVARAKRGFDQDWLFWLFASEDFIKSASGGSGGTRMPRADWNYLKDIIWPVPELSEQKQIAEILSSLNDKIELNREINANLEKLASSLFKKWFVDIEAKLLEGWTTEFMTDYVTIEKGISYKGSDLNESGRNVLVGLKCFERGGGFRVVGIKRYSGEFKRQHLLQAGDLVVAMTDLTQGAEVLGKPALVPNIKNADYIVASLDTSILRPKSGRISKAYLYLFFMRQETQDFLFGFSNGSTVLHLSIDGLRKIKLVIPPEKEMQKFNTLVEPMFEKIQLIESEINNLVEIRDSLLSRLMSGKIRVK